MKIFLQIYLLAILCLNNSVVCAQRDTINNPCSISFKGKVVDGETKEPLHSANVFVEEINKGVLTDEKGNFIFTSFCPGTYTIVCSHFGYKFLTTLASINKDTYKSFILHSDTCVLESIEIEVAKPLEEFTVPAAVLEGKELDKTRGLSLGESLNHISGVYSVQTGPTIFKPVIQGVYGTRVLIMNNGVRQEGQQWGNEHAPEVDPFIAGKITVVKGASSVMYGSDPIGGVILVDPKPLRKEQGLGGEFNMVGFSNNREGVLSGIVDYNLKSIPALSARIQGTFKQAGNSKTPDYYMKNTGLKENNFSAALEYDKKSYGVGLFYSRFNTDIGIFSASHIGNLSDFNRAINSSVPLETSGFTYKIESPYQKINHDLFKARGFLILNKIGKLEAVYAIQRNYRAEYDKHNQNEPSLEFDISTQTANLILEHDPVKNFLGTIGVSGIYQANIFHGRFFIPNFRSYAGGIFLIEKWKRNKLELEVGLRYDYKFLEIYKWENNVIISPAYIYNNFSGSAGGIYKLNNHWMLRANFGTAYRPPSVGELFSEGLHHGVAAIEYGDRNLVPEVAYNITSTASFIYKKMQGEINLFNNYIYDFIFLAPVFPATLTIRGAFPTYRYKQTNAVFYGTDISLSDTLTKHVVYDFKLSIIKAYNTKDNSYLVSIPPSRIENGVKYLFKNYSNLKESYFALKFVYVAKQNRVEANSDYVAPPPGYLLLNFEIGTGLLLGKQLVNIEFGVNNVLDTKYRDYLDRFRYYSDAVGRNIILRIKVPFSLVKK